MLESKLPTDQAVIQNYSLQDQIRFGLEYRVLELIITGYKKMSEAGRYNVEWKENKFTAVLKAYIKKHCQEFSKLTMRNWCVDREYYHDSKDVIEGEGDPDTTPRIDIIILTWTAEYEEIRFPFECKLLDVKSTDLIRLYVKNGIQDRYLTEKDYSDQSLWGGMIGYVVNGEHDQIVSKLNVQIDKQLKSSGAHLKIYQPVTSFEAIYRSMHQHPHKAELLTITHLLFSFTK